MMSITKDMGLRILAILFPPACLACHRVEGVSCLPLGLCSRCRLEVGQPQLSPDGILSRWSYAPPFDAVIQALKFGHLEFLGEDLADGLHRLMVESTELEIDVIVPIPLHWYRRLTRGYNQAEAIARPLATRLGRPMVAALRRCRWTAPQARLGRSSREANLRRAFALRRSAASAIEGRRILLVDDVVTTGATLRAGAESLRQAGAQSILALVAARTPTKGNDCGT